MKSRWKSLLCAALPPLCFAAYPLACWLFALCGIRLTLLHPSAYAAVNAAERRENRLRTCAPVSVSEPI